MFGRQPGADLKQRLPWTVDQLVEDDPPGPVGQCAEEFDATIHGRDDRQALTCVSTLA